jgi:hypothetical protein
MSVDFHHFRGDLISYIAGGSIILYGVEVCPVDAIGGRWLYLQKKRFLRAICPGASRLICARYVFAALVCVRNLVPESSSSSSPFRAGNRNPFSLFSLSAGWCIGSADV